MKTLLTRRRMFLAGALILTEGCTSRMASSKKSLFLGSFSTWLVQQQLRNESSYFSTSRLSAASLSPSLPPSVSLFPCSSSLSAAFRKASLLWLSTSSQIMSSGALLLLILFITQPIRARPREYIALRQSLPLVLEGLGEKGLEDEVDALLVSAIVAAGVESVLLVVRTGAVDVDGLLTGRAFVVEGAFFLLLLLEGVFDVEVEGLVAGAQVAVVLGEVGQQVDQVVLQALVGWTLPHLVLPVEVVGGPVEQVELECPFDLLLEVVLQVFMAALTGVILPLLKAVDADVFLAVGLVHQDVTPQHFLGESAEEANRLAFEQFLVQIVLPQLQVLLLHQMIIRPIRVEAQQPALHHKPYRPCPAPPAQPAWMDFCRLQPQSDYFEQSRVSSVQQQMSQQNESEQVMQQFVGTAQAAFQEMQEERMQLEEGIEGMLAALSELCGQVTSVLMARREESKKEEEGRVIQYLTSKSSHMGQMMEYSQTQNPRDRV